MTVIRLSLPWIAYSLLVPLLALPSSHALNIFAAVPEKRSTISSTKIKISPALPAAHNGKFTPNFMPDCWSELPSPSHQVPPITNPRDCGEAIIQLISEGHATEPIVWFAQHDWVYDSCGIFLVPLDSIRTPRDTFSRFDIVRDASTIQIACVNQAHGFRGGKMPIGVGIFEVALFGRPLTLELKEGWQNETANETTLEEWALPLQALPQPSSPPSLPSNTEALAVGWHLYCWPSSPPPSGHMPITTPQDCGSAILQIIQEGQAIQPVLWATSHSWVYGSCSIRLVPDYLGSRDTFSRLDIVRTVSRIQTTCVNEAHGFRGGSVGVGPMGVFDVFVEAPDDHKLEDRDYAIDMAALDSATQLSKPI